MRELKFRAYIEENGRKSFEFIDLNATNTDELARFHAVANKYGVIKEQYTGLKDKNGKPIYEGDIVLNTYYDDDEMYKILWADDSVAFGMESLDDMELYKLPLESLKVIGNIHENHELLEEEE